MDEKNVQPDSRRQRETNPLMPSDGRTAKTQEKNPDVYKLRILTIILVGLIIALIAAFVSEVGIYGGSKSSGRSSKYESIGSTEWMTESLLPEREERSAEEAS